MTEYSIERLPCDKCRLRLYTPCTGPCKKWREWHQDVLEKLTNYEFAEREGKMIILPYKVGETVFATKKEIEEALKEIEV